MRFNKRYLAHTISVAILILMACNREKQCEEAPCIHLKTNEHGIVVKKYVNHVDPNIPDSIYYYYDDGSLEMIAEYQNGLENERDGWVVFYDTMGVITNRDLYIQGIPTKSIKYYPNGVMQAIFEIFYKTRVGNAYYYDSTGRFHSYVCYDFEDFYIYRKEYPSGQNPRITFQQDGMIAQYWFTTIDLLTADSEKMKVDSFYFCHAVIPNPPDKRRSVQFKLSDNKGEIINKSSISDTTGVVTFPFRFSRPGDYLLTITSALIDPIEQKAVKTDSMSHQIKVLRIYPRIGRERKPFSIFGER